MKMKLLRKKNGNGIVVINEKDGLLYFSDQPKQFYYYQKLSNNKYYCWQGII